MFVTIKVNRRARALLSCPSTPHRFLKHSSHILFGVSYKKGRIKRLQEGLRPKQKKQKVLTLRGKLSNLSNQNQK